VLFIAVVVAAAAAAAAAVVVVGSFCWLFQRISHGTTSINNNVEKELC